MRSEEATVDAYLAALPAERHATMSEVLALVRGSLPDGYAEVRRWGMITWEVPPEASGPTYNGAPLMHAALASQKRHMALYLGGANCVPAVRGRLQEAFRAAGKRLDMGAACLRFRRSEDLAPEAVAEAVAALPVADFVAAAGRRSARADR